MGIGPWRFWDCPGAFWLPGREVVIDYSLSPAPPQGVPPVAWVVCSSWLPEKAQVARTRWSIQAETRLAADFTACYRVRVTSCGCRSGSGQGPPALGPGA